MRSSSALLHSVIVLISLSFLSCGQRDHSKSSLDTVEVPQTEIRDQERVGFCWAYATVALIESNYKTQTTNNAQISPEAIGFYRMATGLFQATRAKSISDLMPLLSPGGLEGYYVKLPQGGGDALNLLEQYGVVPESVWSFKFDTDNKSKDMMRAMQGGLWVLLRDRLLRGKDASDITMDDIINKVMMVKGAFPVRPPTSFDMDGVNVSSTSYLRDVLGFKTEDYVAVRIDSATDYARFIQGTKRALVRGIGVPLAFPVSIAQLQADTFTGIGTDATTNFAKDGAHAVLIKDWVNTGKEAGALSLSEVTEELKKSETELDHFIFKNSWGKNATKNESGKIVTGSENGYYKIDRLYLEGSAAQALREPDMRNIFSVMLPKDIANAPFDDEVVNPTIAKK